MTPLDLDRLDSTSAGSFDVRYVAFLQTLVHLRAPLHRYCSRMTGSLLDGEDVMQEALFEAYRKLDQLEEPGALRPWLFRIAHHRCLDFIRQRSVRRNAEAQLTPEDAAAPADPPSLGVGRAVERLVLHLPPKERACVLLKDVLDHSLEEIAQFVDSTPGGVKAALNRARNKLAALAAEPPVLAAEPPVLAAEPPVLPTPPDAAAARLLSLYVERFNRQDWSAVRELVSADARLLVADRYAGQLASSPYFGRYEEKSFPWFLAVGQLEGEPVVLVLPRAGAEPTSVVRLVLAAERIVAIRDYHYCHWLVPAAADVHVVPPHPIGAAAWNP
jgi:RNA polymerase sigma-70 factor (ECF subfamily)